MNGWNNWGVRRKLFTIILLILVLNVVLLFFMGSMLFEHFYQANKISALESSARRIKAAYEQNSDTIFEELSNIENENMQVSLLAISKDGNPEMLYHSRTGKTPAVPSWNVTIPMEITRKEQQFREALRERIERTGEEFLIEKGEEDNDRRHDGKFGPGNVLSLSARLDDNLYLYIETPREYIKSTAVLAVRYTSGMSIVILLVGAVAIYFAVARMARPLSQIGVVAGQIAQLDFSQKCTVHGGDEIAQLAGNINDMSAALQDAVNRMMEANTVLQNDLVRQQQTDQMRRQFIANVSHDFKTPLTLMISYAEALGEDENLDDEGREYCTIIIGEGNKLSRMVGKLLGLSKLESGVDKVEASYFCLSEVVDAVLKNHRILTEKQGIHVLRGMEDEFIVRADFPKIEQVVTNLFENAVKYTPEGGQVRISAMRAEDHCRIEIENTGVPICTEDQDSLFDSFYRADKSRAAGDSYGLGLAIVKVVMEAHGQGFGVRNTDDGVCFWFELELADFDEDEPEENK